MNEPEYNIIISLFCSKCGAQLAFEASDPIGTDSWSSTQLSVKPCDKCERLKSTKHKWDNNK